MITMAIMIMMMILFMSKIMIIGYSLTTIFTVEMLLPMLRHRVAVENGFVDLVWLQLLELLVQLLLFLQLSLWSDSDDCLLTISARYTHNTLTLWHLYHFSSEKITKKLIQIHKTKIVSGCVEKVCLSIRVCGICLIVFLFYWW